MYSLLNNTAPLVQEEAAKMAASSCTLMLLSPNWNMKVNNKKENNRNRGY